MASIVNNRAIRETRDKSLRGGKNLVYGIGKIDHAKALRIHDRIYDHALSEDRKRTITSVEMRQWVAMLAETDDPVVWDRLLKDISWRPRGMMAKYKWSPNQDPEPSHDIFDLIRTFNQHRSTDHVLPYLPGNVPMELKTYLIGVLLSKGTLLNRSAKYSGKTATERLVTQKPSKERSRYFSMLEPSDVAYARQKFREIQEMRDQGSNWYTYLKSKSLSVITEVDETHVKGFIAWRRKFRKKKNWKGDVSDRIIRGELTYFSRVCQYAVYKKLISRNLAEGIKIPRHRTAQAKHLTANEPLSIAEVKSALDDLAKKMRTSKNESNHGITRLNCLTVFFLILTGCRPKEAGQFTHDREFICFHRSNLAGAQGGKTDSASRRIRITPTLKKILDEGILEENRKTVDLCARIHQFLHKCGLSFAPYRLRHTVSTIRFKAEGESAPQIAYELGHSDPSFSYRKYTNLHAYSSYSTEEILAFWTWLHHKFTYPLT